MKHWLELCVFLHVDIEIYSRIQIVGLQTNKQKDEKTRGQPMEQEELTRDNISSGHNVICSPEYLTLSYVQALITVALVNTCFSQVFKKVTFCTFFYKVHK